ncbi:MAG: lipopolysaccharide kinase InaA family protein [Planctomycetota bacterium]|jgi:hypothetical protein|nr:lipopolysaccharide kinase InaA family protein [Planctomycetota bacterium]
MQTFSLPKQFKFETSHQAKLGKNLADGLQDAVATGDLIKDEEETLLVRDSKDCWWKLYRVPLRRRFFAFAARSRARREWRALRAFTDKGVPAVTPLGMGEERKGPILLSSLLVTKGIPKGEDLRVLFKKTQGSEREQLLQKAGQAIRKLHDAGFVHFRMQTRNLIAAETEQTGDSTLLWLDTPYSCHFSTGAPHSLRILDLVDFAGNESVLSLDDARALLVAYANGAAPITTAEALHSRNPLGQKLRRIIGYLLAINTGHRP